MNIEIIVHLAGFHIPINSKEDLDRVDLIVREFFRQKDLHERNVPPIAYEEMPASAFDAASWAVREFGYKHREQIAEMARQGMGAMQIGAVLGISHQRVCQVLQLLEAKNLYLPPVKDPKEPLAYTYLAPDARLYEWWQTTGGSNSAGHCHTCGLWKPREKMTRGGRRCLSCGLMYTREYRRRQQTEGQAAGEGKVVA